MKHLYSMPAVKTLTLKFDALLAQSTQTEDLQEVTGSWDDSTF